jgi:hypothetical protein
MLPRRQTLELSRPSASDPKRTLLSRRPASRYTVHPNQHIAPKVSISYPNLAFANMLLHVRNDLGLRLEVPELPVYLNQNVISANERANQRVDLT